MSTSAPFVSDTFDDDIAPANTWAALRQYGFWRLFLAQCVSSLGDWIGIFAVLAIAARVSDSPEAAVVLVMVARILPGFFLASIGGLLVDKWDRRRTMIVCDLGRAGLLLLLPFWNSLVGLIVISLLLEMLTLLWGPAKDASLPHLISSSHLSTANSLGLLAAYGTFPIGSLLFAGLARIALAMDVDEIFSISVDRQFLALWVDASTYIVSAALIFSLGAAFKRVRESSANSKENPVTEKIKKAEDSEKSKRIDVMKGFRDIKDGYSFIAKHRVVRGVMIGLGLGIFGGGALVPLGSLFATDVLKGGEATYSLLMTALGTGAAIGVISLQVLQKNLKRGTVFWCAIVLCGISMAITGLSSSTLLALFGIGIFGASAGCGYVIGFTILQEEVHDDVRGRTFAALYTIIRVCMLLGMTVAPLFSRFFQWAVVRIFDSTVISIGNVSYSIPGIRVVIVIGGLVMVLGGFISRYQVVHPDENDHDVSAIQNEAEGSK